MAQTINIPFLTTTTHANHTDGDLSVCVNMRPENGSLKPVAPPKVMQELDKLYDIVFLHRGNGYENWIGVVVGQTKESTVYSNIKDEPTLLATISGTVRDIEQIGNLLVFISDNGMLYAQYKEGVYKYLGKMPELPDMSFKVANEYTVKRSMQQELGKKPDALKDIGTYIKAMMYSARNIIVNGGKALTTDNDEYDFAAKKYVLFDAHLVRYAFRLYDGTIIKHSSPILVMPARRVLGLHKYQLASWDLTDISADTSFAWVTGYNLNLNIYANYDIGKWGDVIKSVDVFMSPPLGITNLEKVLGKDIIDGATDLVALLTSGLSGNLFKEISDEALENINNEGNFYLVDSIKFDGSKKSITFPTDSDLVRSAENLIYGERMTLNPFSHHDYRPQKTNVFNQRLRLGGYSVKLYNGHSIPHFEWEGKYNGIEYQVDGGSGKGGFDEITDPSQPGFDELQPHTEYTPQYTALYTFVYLKTEKGEEIRKVRFDSDTNISSLNAILSYPDTRAYKLEIYLEMINNVDGSLFYTKMAEFALKPHKSLNLAYFLSPRLEPIAITPKNNTIASTTVPSETVGIVEEYGTIKVSELNNPFVFPVQNTYKIGLGRILAESALVMNVTDRNYGTYPTFVFTDNGIFTMSGQTADVIHASVQAPTSTEVPINDLICPTPYGVAFITQRGLHLINQNGVQFLTELVEHDAERLQIADIPNVAELNWNSYLDVSFPEYAKSANLMFYDPKTDELHIKQRNATHGFVFSFNRQTKGVYLTTYNATDVVRNVYPDLYVLNNLTLLDYSQKETDEANISVLSRPLRFGNVDIKNLERTKLRGTIKAVGGNNATCIYVSDDGIHFNPRVGRKIAAGEYIDTDFGRIVRTKFRFYLFGFVGKLKADSELRLTEWSIYGVYDRDKMR